MAEKKFVLIPGTGSHTEPSKGKVYKAEIDGPPVIVKSDQDLVAKFPGKFRLFRTDEDLKPIGDVDDDTPEHDPRTMRANRKAKKDPHALPELKGDGDAPGGLEESDGDEEVKLLKTGDDEEDTITGEDASDAAAELDDEDDDKEPPAPKARKGSTKSIDLEDDEDGDDEDAGSKTASVDLDDDGNAKAAKEPGKKAPAGMKRKKK